MASVGNRSKRLCSAMLAAAAVTLASCGGGGGADGSSSSTGGSGGVQSPSPPAAPAATCGLADFETELLQRVNAQRAAGADCGTHGRFAASGALTWNLTLESAASGHSADMAGRNFFAHTNPDSATVGNRVTAAGYAWSKVAENIAAGQSSIAQVVDGWMASDGHCANIMDPNLRDIGVACVSSGSADYPTYWTMDLAAPR